FRLRSMGSSTSPFPQATRCLCLVCSARPGGTARPNDLTAETRKRRLDDRLDGVTSALYGEPADVIALFEGERDGVFPRLGGSSCISEVSGGQPAPGGRGLHPWLAGTDAGGACLRPGRG